MLSDPIPPGHGEPENVGASPSDLCDRCGRPSVDTIARFDLHFCRSCGASRSLVEMLEHKYGRERAHEILEAQ